MNRYTWRTGVLEMVMVVAAVIVAFPMYILLNLAFRSPDDNSSAVHLTSHPTLRNFTKAWHEGALGNAIFNSVFITVCGVLISVAVAALAAYPLARVARKWSKLTFGLIMFGLLLPFQLAALPLYQTMNHLGLLGTRWSLVLYYAGLQVPFTTFLYVGFLRALPRDFEEAALIDGCTPMKAFRHVVFPSMKPINATAIVLNAVFIWNDFFTPLLYLSGSGNQTLPVAINGFVGQYSAQWNLIFAALTIAIIPILVVYFALQRSIINGFAGGLKG